MRKAILMALAGLALQTLAPAPVLAVDTIRKDGSWFEDKNYGGPGDTVVDEVKAQQAEYRTAATKAEKLYTEWTKAKGQAKKDKALELRKAQEEAAKLATYSWVEASYLAEAARIAELDGDLTAALDLNKRALAAADRAVKMDEDDEQLGSDNQPVWQKSHEQGSRIQRLVTPKVARLGGS